MLTYVFNLYWMLGIQAQWNTCTATSPAVAFLLQLLHQLPVIWPATATVVTMASSLMGAPLAGMLSVHPVTLLLFNAVSIMIMKDLTCTCSVYHMQSCAVGVPTSAFLLAWFVHVLTCSFISYADLTVGEVVGIAIACFIFLALIIAIPIVICCCCACGIACFAARKSWYHQRNCRSQSHYFNMNHAYN